MDILEITKKENVGKRYEFKNEIYVLRKRGTLLCLERERDEEDIEEIHPFFIIVTGEYEEAIDWNEVPVDTNLLVSRDGEDWYRRHFAYYAEGEVYCFNNGHSSFTIIGTDYEDHAIPWKYAKLYKE